VDLTSPPEGVPIEDVARNHPARVILLHHDPDASGADAANAGPEPSLIAQVGVLTFGPPDTRYGIEQIAMKSTCSEAALPSLVRRFAVGDVPTSIWWTEDVSGTRPLAPLVTMGRQFLYDSRRWQDVRGAVLALVPLLADPFGPDLADLNWRRLQSVRQAIVHAIESGETAKRQDLTSVHIRYRPGEAALAWLLAGWLHSAEYPAGGPPPSGSSDVESRPDPISNVEEDPALGDGDDVLTASFGDGFQLRLGKHEVSIDDSMGPAPFAVAVPSETEAEAVAAELRVLTHDASLHAVLAVLAERFANA
jgi:hypothetical protein